ncbi:MAG: ABC transporter ATP-binding protein, partial [Myxococcota bacterium]|nr:ABC transporter ATP-binding protein [Myxococcota bacterium]
MTEGTGAAVMVSSLSRRFGRQWAVRHISVGFDAGAVAVVIGHNGAGKSTLLALLAGAIRPTEGRVVLLGTPLEEADPALRARVAWLPHKPFVYPDLTGREVLAFVARLYGRSGDTTGHESLLERVGLAAAAHRKVRTYSRGMVQRL